MGDSSRAEKLAAARKKLKQFQQKTGRTPASSPAGSGKGKKSKKDEQTEQFSDTKPPSGPENGPRLATTPPRLDQMDSSASPMKFAKAARPDENTSVYSTPPSSTSMHTNLRPSSSAETLQQLTRQVNGLLEETSSYSNGTTDDLMNSSIAELEARNRDLAALLDHRSKENSELNTSLSELKQHNNELVGRLDSERGQFENRLRKEVSTLKEQLQVHIQTIGILVAEKSELQTNVNHSQKQIDQQQEELEELSGRLKASRQRVADLERNFSSANTSSQQYEKTTKELNKEVDRLKLDIYKSNKSLEEVQQQSSELQSKLHSKTSECAGLEETVKDLQGKLEMSELYIQQISNHTQSTEHSSDMLQQLQTNNTELQARVEQYQEAFQQLSNERDHMQEQYQQYAEQLNQRAVQLVSQVQTLTEEREQLQSRTEELEEASSPPSTVRRLESENSKGDESPAKSDNSDSVNQQILALKEELLTTHQEYDALCQKHESLVNDNAQLSRLLSEKEVRIMELDSTVSQLGSQTSDREQLLESIQGDKAALSRALTQNKELKSQLGELQEAFVKMSNDNMEVVTKLQAEEHVAKELGDRLGQQEDELKEVRRQLEDKEQQLEYLESNSHQLNKQLFQQEQLADRMRHFEAQGQLADTLQRELNSAQETINALTAQNSELRTLVIQKENTPQAPPSNSSHDDTEKEDLINSLSTSVRQLEMERNEVLHKLDEVRRESEALKVQYDQVLNDSNAVSMEQYEKLQTAMDQIQEKYTEVMRLRADLQDRNEQLEHRVMVLEGETDTIGEYITLYQQQRAALQERESEKNEYIAHLAKDREEMQTKLAQLQALVMQLLQERKQLHNYREVSPAHPPIHQSQVANHSPPPPSTIPPASGDEKKLFAGTLDSSNLEDWPDYSSSADSDVSEVEAIVASGGDQHVIDSSVPRTDISMATSTPARPQLKPPFAEQQWNVPAGDHTAQKIITLLTELGSANVVPRVDDFDKHLMPCKCCSGRLLVV